MEALIVYRIIAGVVFLSAICFAFSVNAASVRGKPVYPEEALRECIEGYVVLEYTLTEDGRAKNIVVIDSDPPGVFDSAATKALEQWELEPREVDGVKVTVQQVQVTIRFEIDEIHLHCHSTHLGV